MVLENWHRKHGCLLSVGNCPYLLVLSYNAKDLPILGF
ncbi:hypothetical protein HBZS_111440 [Helicobacter bizzozeronii CCUG 35545]|nr:hypothetical protein HBZS_111440 [Helicobacter bizzozeronii CCUG 35545]